MTNDQVDISAAHTLCLVMAVLGMTGAGWAAGPLTQPVEPCTATASAMKALELQPDGIASSLAVAAGDHETREPVAIAIELVDPLDGTSTVHIRFVPPAGHSSMGQKWSWTAEATAVLGPGTGPSLARLPGPAPIWLVLMARPDPGGSRPVVATVRLDSDSHRLELDSLILEPVDHVFGPRVLTMPEGSLLVWGESGAETDRIVTLAWPVSDDVGQKTITTGRFTDIVAAAGFDDSGVIAWIEQDTSAGSQPWSLGAAVVTRYADIVHGPTRISTFDERPVLEAAGTRGKDLVAHLLVPDPVSWHPLMVTMSPQLVGQGSAPLDYPKIAPGSTSASAILPDGDLGLGWSNLSGDLSLIEVWTSGGIWIGSADQPGAPLAMDVDAGGLVLAFSDDLGASVVTTSLRLEDDDSDTIPDGVDLCRSIPEPIDGVLDHDGCPDPSGTGDSPWDENEFWFPVAMHDSPCMQLQTLAVSGSKRMFIGSANPHGSAIVDPDGSMRTVSDLASPVSDALALPDGAWLVVADAQLFEVYADLSVERVDLDAEGLDTPPEIRKLDRLAATTIVVTTSAGAAIVSQPDLSVDRWLASGESLVDAAVHDEGALLMLTEEGKVLSFTSNLADPMTIEKPKVAAGDRPIGVVSAAGAIHVAWRKSGVLTLEPSQTKFVKLPETHESKPPQTGAVSIASLESGAVSWIDTKGRPWSLTPEGWSLRTAGVETTWVGSVHADRSADRFLIIGSDGSARVMALLEQISMIEVGAEHFVKSSSKLKASGTALVQPLLQMLASSGAVVRIEGHTDSSGASASNLTLSFKRARGIGAWLMDHGVAPATIQIMGYGEMFPVDDPASLTNRRVVLRLLSL